MNLLSLTEEATKFISKYVTETGFEIFPTTEMIKTWGISAKPLFDVLVANNLEGMRGSDVATFERRASVWYFIGPEKFWAYVEKLENDQDRGFFIEAMTPFAIDDKTIRQETFDRLHNIVDGKQTRDELALIRKTLNAELGILTAALPQIEAAKQIQIRDMAISIYNQDNRLQNIILEINLLSLFKALLLAHADGEIQLKPFISELDKSAHN